MRFLCGRKVLDSSHIDAGELLIELKFHSLLDLYTDNQAMQKFFLYNLDNELVQEYIDAIKYDNLSQKIYNLTLEQNVERRITERGKLYLLSNSKYWKKIVDDFVYPLKDFFYYTSSVQNNELIWEDNHGGVYSIDRKKFIKYNASSNAEYKILDGTLVVANEAFKHNTSLINIDMPSSVVVIGDRASYHCENLKKIDTYLSSKSNEHEEYAIYNAPKRQVPYTIGENVFAGSFKLETIILPNKIKCILENVFLDNLQVLILPENLVICSCLNLGRCKNFQNLICNSHYFINEKGLFCLKGKGWLYYYFSDNEYLQLPSTTFTRIMPFAFSRNKRLKGIIVPASIYVIDDFAFFDCTNLEYIQLLGSNVDFGEYVLHEFIPIKEIDDDPYWVIYSLKAIIVPIGSLNYYDKMLGYHLSKYLIESNEIATSYSDFERIVSEAKAKEVVPKVYAYSLNDTEYWINEENCHEEYKETFSIDDIPDEGVVYSKDMKTLIKCPMDMTGVFMIPDGVRFIGEKAFEGCEKLLEVIFPNSLVKICDYAFSGCTRLSQIVIPASVEIIGTGGFSNCSTLASVTISYGLNSLSHGVFQNCSSLTKISIPESVTYIGKFVFSGCSNLKSVIIPDSVKFIKYKTFSDCTKLTDLIIPSNITEIENAAFKNCSNLLTIIIPERVTKIGTYTFSGCTSLKSVVIPDSVTKIDAWAFSGCKKLTNINIGKGVKEIGCRAFYDCVSLNEIILYPTTPPIVYNDTFWEIGVGGTIFVPKGSCKAYSKWMYDTCMPIFVWDCKEINNHNQKYSFRINRNKSNEKK